MATAPPNSTPGQLLEFYAQVGRITSGQLPTTRRNTTAIYRGSSLTSLSAPSSKTTQLQNMIGQLKDTPCSAHGHSDQLVFSLDDRPSSTNNDALSRKLTQKEEIQHEETPFNKKRERSESILEHEQLPLQDLSSKKKHSIQTTSPVESCLLYQDAAKNDVDEERPLEKGSGFQTSAVEIEGGSSTTRPEFLYVKITDANRVYNMLNLGRKIDVVWPNEEMQRRGGQNYWGYWTPLEGMHGPVVHTWVPHHKDPKCRACFDKTIYLVQIEDKFVPVEKEAVEIIS